MRSLTPHEFYKQLGRKLDLSEERTQFIWENIVDFFVDELKNYGSVRTPTLGIFVAEVVPEREYHIPNSEMDKERLGTTDASRIEVIPEYIKVKFLPSDRFKDVMNDKMVTTAVWKQARQMIRKQQTKEEELKNQEEILVKRQNAMESVRLQRLQKIKENKEFKKLSKKKQNEILKKPSDWEEE